MNNFNQMLEAALPVVAVFAIYGLLLCIINQVTIKNRGKKP